jgi:hypothetical protein
MVHVERVAYKGGVWSALGCSSRANRLVDHVNLEPYTDNMFFNALMSETFAWNRSPQLPCLYIDLH